MSLNLIIWLFYTHLKQEIPLIKTGRKIERNANLILYFNASFFIYKVKRASLSVIDYDSVSGFSTKKKLIPKQLYISKLNKSPFTCDL